MRKRGYFEGYLIVGLIAIGVFFLLTGCVFADPEGPSDINVTENETYSASTSGTMVNISGGRIATLNISSTTQNPHWKAFVGWVNGIFALKDSSGSTIYDWSLSTSTGRVYATRNSSTVNWTNVNCSNVTLMEAENALLSHTNVDDNISATFSDNDHSPFYVAGTYIAGSTCPTTSTHVDNSSQDIDFEEMVLYDFTYNNTIFATILENNADGFDENNYDFQMLVPENGSVSWQGAIPYYVYVEVS